MPRFTDHPSAVDAVDAGAHGWREGVLAEEGRAVGQQIWPPWVWPAKADIGAGGNCGVDEVGVVQEHELEVVG